MLFILRAGQSLEVSDKEFWGDSCSTSVFSKLERQENQECGKSSKSRKEKFEDGVRGSDVTL